MARKQRPRGTLTSQEIVSAALELADRDGLEGLTIRSVARTVGAPPMSLYTHFANKSALLDLMYAEVSRRLYEDEGNPTWQGETRVLAGRIRKTLTAHPNWVKLFARPVPPMSLPMRERVLGLMVADGMPERESILALTSVTLVTIGLTFMELTLKPPDGDSGVERRFENLKAWSETAAARDNPMTRAVLDKVGRNVLDETFESTIDALIAGFEALRKDAPRPRGDAH